LFHRASVAPIFRLVVVALGRVDSLALPAESAAYHPHDEERDREHVEAHAEQAAEQRGVRGVVLAHGGQQQSDALGEHDAAVVARDDVGEVRLHGGELRLQAGLLQLRVVRLRAHVRAVQLPGAAARPVGGSVRRARVVVGRVDVGGPGVAGGGLIVVQDLLELLVDAQLRELGHEEQEQGRLVLSRHLPGVGGCGLAAAGAEGDRGASALRG